MNKNIKDLDKYTEKGGSIKIKKEVSELNSWYDLEEILHEAHEQSGCNLDKEECSLKAQAEWEKITGRGRKFNCLFYKRSRRDYQAIRR